MDCLVKYNEQGAIESVKGKDGKESEIFHKLASIPVLSVDEALEAYKATFAESVGEATEISFRTDQGKVTNSYKDALKGSTNTISVEVNSKEIATIPASKNPTTKAGLINNLITQGMLNDETEMINGIKTYTPFGVAGPRSIVSSVLLREVVRANNLGKYTFNQSEDGSFTLEDRPNIKNMTDAEIREKATEDVVTTKFASEVALEINANHSLDSRESEYTGSVTKMTEDTLRNQLTQLMADMGIQLMSIEEYKKKYKDRTGVEIGAEAFADIANSVIAFQGDQIDTKTLSEEVFHFLIEGMEQTQVDQALEEVVETETYQEISEMYRERYASQNPSFSAEEVETMVRKEALAKEIVKNLHKEEVETKSNIFTEFFERIKEFLKGLVINKKVQSNIKKITESVARMVQTRNIEESLNMEQIRNSRYLLYSLNNPVTSETTKNLVNTLSKFISTAESNERLIRNEKNIGGSSKLKKIRRIKEKMITGADLIATQAAVSDLLDVIGSKIDFMSDAFKVAESEQIALGREESAIIEQLITVYKPALNSVLASIGTDPEYKRISKMVSERISQISMIEGKRANFNDNTIAKLVERVISRSPKAAEFKDEAEFKAFVDNVVKGVNEHNKDTGSLYMYYGQITHARDPYLGLGGRIIADLQNDMEYLSTQRLKGFVSRMGELLGSPEALNTLLKNKGDKIASYYDFDAFNSDIARIQKDAHIKALKSDGFTAEEIKAAMPIIEKYYNNEINYNEMSDSVIKVNGVEKGISLQGSEIREVEFNEYFKENTLDIIERTMTPEYYKEQAENFKKYKLSNVTKVYLSDESSTRGEIVSRGRDENGEFWSTRALKNEMESLNGGRRRAESPFDSMGNVKEGLKVLTELEYQELSDKSVATPINRGMYLRIEEGVEPSREATISFELNRMRQIQSEIREAEKSKNGSSPMFTNNKLSDSFLSRLADMESRGLTRKEIKDFILYNMNINIVGDFWENLVGSETNSTIAEDVMSGMQRRGERTELGEFREIFLNKKSAEIRRDTIMKAYRDSKDGTNIKVTDMGSDVIEVIRDLTDAIDQFEAELRSKNSEYKQRVSEREFNTDDSVENTPNQNWYAYLNDHGIEYSEENVQDIYEIARKHMSSTTTMRVQDTITELIGIASGRLTVAKDRTNKQVSRRLGINEEITKDNAAGIAIKMIEGAIGKHFQSTAPKGLNTLMREIHESKTGRPLSEVVKDIEALPNIELSNHYSLYESEETDFLNPNYDTRQTGERYQPNLRNVKYRNQEFLNKVGATVDSSGAIVKDSNNKNQKAYDMYIEFQLENMGLYNTGMDLSVYDKINVRQSNYDRIANLVTGKNVKGNLKEALLGSIKFRVDEEEIGAVEGDGKTVREKTSMKTFPKPFVRKLEDSSTRTEDNLFALVTFTQAAHMFDSRTRYYGDIMALKNSMLERGSVDGKPAGTTNSYKMLGNYIDSTFFGINETANRKVKLPVVGEVDIAKLFTTLHSFVRWKNLSYNIVVPVTSYFTARIGLAIEERTGQYIDSDSVKMARAKYRTNFFTASKEAFTLDSKNYLNVLGEHLGFFDFSNRFENAGRSKLARFLSKMGFGLHTAANFEPLSLAMMSNLYGHRVYDGKVIDFNTYKKVTGKTAKEAKAGWSMLKDKNFAEYIIVEGAKVRYDYAKFMADMNIPTMKETVEVFAGTLDAVRNRGKKLVERIDGTIKSEERTMLQRNFFGKFTMTHKGWLAIALANKFKYKHFNYQTLMEEEGSYVTGARQIGRALKEAILALRGKGEMSKAWAHLTGSQSEDYVKHNMRRNLVEFSAASTIFLLASIVAGFAGDDDNKDMYGMQLSAYMLERINNEQNSQQFGLYEEVYNAVESPVVGMKQIVQMFDVTKLFDGSEKARGRYQGVPTNLSMLIDNIAPAKQFYQLSSAKNLKYQKDVYQYYNALNDNQLISKLISSERIAEIIQGR